MAGADNHKLKNNAALHTVTVDVGVTEGDLWYNSTEGRVKVRVTSQTGIAGPHGNHSLIHNVANSWYTPAGGSNGALTTQVLTNDRAYAWPLFPGRKCTLTGLAMSTGAGNVGVGNFRAALYDSASTGFPGSLIADYGTQSATLASTVRSGWTVSTALLPVPYWVVIASQTTVAPTVIIAMTTVPMIATPIAVPLFGATANMTALYTDTGFGGAPPGTFGTPAGTAIGPLIFWKLTQ